MSHSTSRAHLGSDDRGDPDMPNEATRLLPDDEEGAAPKKQAQTPLPKAQITALVALRSIDLIAYQQIFPYVNQLLVDMRVAVPERVGFYSGLVESAYSLAQMLSVYHCGRISDVVGRRPVVFTGLVGSALASTAFGLSTSFSGIVASRFICGLVAGNVSVIHSIFGEITDNTNQHLAVPIYSISWQLGAVIGAFIGGTLENAAMRYPQHFSWHIFVEHPYLPPCIATAACAFIALVLGHSFIRETLPSKQKRGHYARTHTTPELRSDTDSNETGSVSVMEFLSIPAIRTLAISGFALSFLSFGFDVVFTLFCYTPVDAGGMGLEPSMIGNALAIAGLITIFVRTPALPYILWRFDCARTYNVCMYSWPFAFGLLPFLNLLVRAFPPSSWTTKPATVVFWTALLVPLILSKVGLTGHNISMLLVKQHAPSPALLGQCNGLVQFMMCVGRTIAPLFVSALFTGANGTVWAKQWGVGGLWAVPVVVGAVAGARVTRRLGSNGS